MDRTSGERTVFLRGWLKSPLKTGAQVPSSRKLARAMAAAAAPAVGETVVEIGPGTGVVTRALLAQGVPAERLLLVELNPDFCSYLRRSFPGVRVVQGDAFELAQSVAGYLDGPVGAVVSSLPLFVYPKERREYLLDQALTVAASGRSSGDATSGGRVVQFTYSTISPFPFDPATVDASVSRRIWLNLWPAVVWTYRRRIVT